MVTVRQMRAFVGACLLAACSEKGTGLVKPTLSEWLQGNWYYQIQTTVDEYLLSKYAALAVDSTTIRYTWNVLWVCTKMIPGKEGTQVPACSLEAPLDRGGYFEGIFRDLGDSLDLLHGVDTLAFLDIAGPEDSAFTFVVNGTPFPMQRR